MLIPTVVKSRMLVEIQRQTFEAMIGCATSHHFSSAKLGAEPRGNENYNPQRYFANISAFSKVPEEFCTSLLVPRLPYFQAILSRTSNENWGITSEKMTSLLTEANVTHSKKAHRKDTAQYFDKFIVLLIYYLLYFMLDQSVKPLFTLNRVALFFFLFRSMVRILSSINPHQIPLGVDVQRSVWKSTPLVFYRILLMYS